ncbi:oral cancer-overexpressed protein 1 [Sipha flava]|jgi:hypothetical protein|uniref:Oral cancer-overexpressed protein 1 n=1 Tax=Sipha flava TaxID=143950 RepID=A0A8B8FXG0_9HEMI|nr:oral cancer-overexpressed protein 1 [Sipha flava]
MSVCTNLDYDSIIDDILLSEKRIAKKNYTEGIEKSFENSYQQGFQIGYQKGHDIGLEIGFYSGILIAIDKLYQSQIIIFSAKELHVLQKLSGLIKAFPEINDKNINIITQYNEIKGLYKKFCFNLKIKDIDKSIFNFSQWNN